jgi:hypothetical protein
MSATPEEKDMAATTGLPGVRSWRAVYALVVGSFVTWVVLLVILGRVFS